MEIPTIVCRDCGKVIGQELERTLAAAEERPLDLHERLQIRANIAAVGAAATSIEKLIDLHEESKKDLEATEAAAEQQRSILKSLPRCTCAKS